jgi:hypothetical protein
MSIDQMFASLLVVLIVARAAWLLAQSLHPVTRTASEG